MCQCFDVNVQVNPQQFIKKDYIWRRVKIKVINRYFPEILEKFENALIVPNSMYHKLSKLSHDGDFHMNLTKFLLAHYPNVYAKENEEPTTVQVVEQTQANKNFKIPLLKLP